MADVTVNIPSLPQIRKSYTQASHGFVVGDVLKISGTNAFAKAQADSVANSRTVGIVTAVADSNNFTITFQGLITAGVPAQAAGTVMYLSSATAGLLTATAPGTNDTPVLVVLENAVSAVFINSLFVAASSGGGVVEATRAELQALLAGGTADTAVTYRITNALTATAVVDVWATTASTISGMAIDHTNSDFGFYNITGDAWVTLYEPNVNLTANRAVVSDTNGNLAASATTATEIGYVNGVTSAIQTQLNSKPSQDSTIIGTNPGGTVVPTGVATRFFSLLSTNTSASVAESQRENDMPRSGTFQRLYVKTQTSQGATGSLVLTVRKNTISTSIVVTVAAGSVAGTFSDLVNTASFNAGDTVALQAVNNHTGGNSAGITSTTIGFQRS